MILEDKTAPLITCLLHVSSKKRTTGDFLVTYFLFIRKAISPSPCRIPLAGAFVSTHTVLDNLKLFAYV